MMTRTRVLLGAALMLWSTATNAQAVLLNETFESTGGLAPPPGWSWFGSPPLFVAGAVGDHGISKETPDQSTPPPPPGSASLLFHPIAYDAAWEYRITGYLRVGGPGAATAAAGALLCWMDIATGQFSAVGNSITSFSTSWQFRVGQPTNASGNPLGPNAQFGIVLLVEPTVTNAFAAFDNILVTGLSPTVAVRPKLWLDGAYDQGTGLMRDDLRVAGLIPVAEPYSALLGGTGGETVAPSVLAVSGPDAIVDWVRVELRSAPDSGSAFIHHALLQRDGDVVGVDGTSPVTFNTAPGLYHVVVRHRNHLAVMTAGALSLTSVPFTIDLRSSSTACFVRQPPNTDLPRRTVGSTLTLWAGDVNGDAQASYMGNGNDRDPILQAIGGTVPTATLTGQYRMEDLNLDGAVKYAGAGNDRDLILQAIGGIVPTAVRVEQVP